MFKTSHMTSYRYRNFTLHTVQNTTHVYYLPIKKHLRNGTHTIATESQFDTKKFRGHQNRVDVRSGTVKAMNYLNVPERTMCKAKQPCCVCTLSCLVLEVERTPFA